MSSWHVRGVLLPYGREVGDWWTDGSGGLREQPVEGAETLPGRYVLAGLVDAHAHPTIGAADGAPGPRSLAATSATLIGWAESGVTLVRDTGSPGGLVLSVERDPRHPRVMAAGRFLAPAGRYFPGLLQEPVEAEQLVAAAVAEVERGAEWVKVIGDFPDVPGFADNRPTYPVGVVAAMCDAVHRAGARVAVHATTAGVRGLVEAGVDSIEHGNALDRSTIELMAARGVAWTPTCSAVTGAADDMQAPERARTSAGEARERFAELLPYAVTVGVPVLAGTDTVGTVADEVALLTRLGLEPEQALAAASDVARAFLRVEGRADLVTYDQDPRADPSLLTSPAAVVIGGTRVR